MKFPSRKTAGKVYLLAAVLCASGLFYSAFFLSLDSPFQTGVLRVSDQYSNIGGGLVHGVAVLPSLSERLPMAAVTAYLTDWGEGSSLHRFVEGLPLIFVSILTLCLGYALVSPKAGWTALVLFLITTMPDTGEKLFRVPTLWVGPMPVYTVLVTLVACVLVLEARRSNVRARLLLAAAIGISLMFRSPLVFLPPLLAAIAFWNTPKRRRRSEAPSLLVLLLVPYLFVAPTVIMNWSVDSTFHPFEKYSGDSNIVTAAAGMVSASSWDWAAVVENAPDLEEGDSVKVWAVREVVRHPLRYTWGLARRIVRVFFYLPLYFLLSAFSLWAFRHRPEFQVLGLLVGYYVGIHCLMAISDIYFMPLAPLLAVLSASAFFASAKGKKPDNAVPVARGVPVIVSVILGCAGALYLYSGWAAVSYGWAAARREPGSLQAMKEAVAAAPANAWLRAASGRKNLGFGRIPAAIEDYSAALSGGHDDADWRLERAWAQMRNGRPEALRDYSPGRSRAEYSSDGFEFILIKTDLGRFFSEKSFPTGPADLPREHLRKAWERWAYKTNAIENPLTQRGKKLLTDMPRKSAGHFFRFVRIEWSYLLSREMRYALVGELIEMSEEKIDLRLEAADLAQQSGDLKRAAEYLSGLSRGELGAREARRADRISGRIQREVQSRAERLAFLEREKNPPKNIPKPQLSPTTGAGWLKAAQAAKDSGKRKSAREALAKAESAGLFGPQWREAAQLYGQLADHSGAVKAYGRIVKNNSGRDMDRIDYAWHLIKVKEFNSAKALLETIDPSKASRDSVQRSVQFYIEMGALTEAETRLSAVLERFPGDPEFLMQAALMYQEMKEYQRVINILAPLTRQGKVAAEALKITGICHFLNGSPEKAIISLKSSIERDPALRSAYASLASVYTSEGRLEEARKVRADAGARRSAGRPGMGAGPQ